MAGVFNPCGQPWQLLADGAEWGDRQTAGPCVRHTRTGMWFETRGHLSVTLAQVWGLKLGTTCPSHSHRYGVWNSGPRVRHTRTGMGFETWGHVSVTLAQVWGLKLGATCPSHLHRYGVWNSVPRVRHTRTGMGFETRGCIYKTMYGKFVCNTHFYWFFSMLPIFSLAK